MQSISDSNGIRKLFVVLMLQDVIQINIHMPAHTHTDRIESSMQPHRLLVESPLNPCLHANSTYFGHKTPSLGVYDDSQNCYTVLSVTQPERAACLKSLSFKPILVPVKI
jgi:hypothetical protein